MRVSTPAPGWRVIKQCAAGGKVLAPVEDLLPHSRLPQPRQIPAKDWSSEAQRYREAVTETELAKLADTLGVGVQALEAIGIGWRPEDRSWTCEERDGAGTIIGINRRFRNGTKRHLRGGKRGLVVPTGLGDLADPILAVEGASDTAACLTMGLAAVGRPSNLAGALMLEPIARDRDIVVVGDNDQKPDGRWPGREGAQTVAARLANALGRPIRWTLPPQGAKDVRDWLGRNKEPDPSRAGQILLKALEASAVEEHPNMGTSERMYEETDEGLVWNKPTSDGSTTVRLTNFVARIVANVVRDDGQETSRAYEIEAHMCGPGAARSPTRFLLAASRFANMSWVYEQLEPDAVIFAGFGIRDHARTAVQMLSTGIVRRHVYVHSGWRDLPGHGWSYLHRRGAISAAGNVADVEVDFHDALGHLELPDPPVGEARADATRTTLALLDLGPDGIIAPLLGAVFRSVLGPSDFSVALVGQTGTFKSELAALAQQHFGAGFDARHLPGSWSSTANAIERIAFDAKDALLVVDDFAPHGSAADISRCHRDADRVLRGQGNRSGRARLRPDGELQPHRSSRGLLLTTGEDIPRGSSLRARQLIIEVQSGDIGAEGLTMAQRAAAAGRFAEAMAGFLQWLAPRYADLRRSVREEVIRFRTEAAKETQHRRTPTTIANIAVGWRAFLDYAVACGAITDAERPPLWQRCWRALCLCARGQSDHVNAADPATRFIELVTAAITSGDAHVVGADGDRPYEDSRSRAWGWRSDDRRGCEPHWHPLGRQIGWIDGQDLYLDPTASFLVAQNLCGPADSIAVSERTLRKRLRDANLLASVDDQRGKLCVRRTLQGQRRNVLHFQTDVLGNHGDSTVEQGPNLDAALDCEGPTQRVSEDNGSGVPAPEAPAQHAQEPQFGPIGPVGPKGSTTDTQACVHATTTDIDHRREEWYQA